MLDQRPALFALWSAVTIFLSAFLLFQVQPVIGKMILPWFGGGPAVWTTCMLFFQMLLLGGYAYAHFLLRLPRRNVQLAVHLGLLIAAVLTLPITPDEAWKPADGTQPTARILVLLAANIGLPYFILAATAPLLQAWYNGVLPGRSPYRLYALSNVGSLGALLSYPFLVEPALTTGTQGLTWSLLFVLFAALCAALAWSTYRGTAAIAAAAEIHRDEDSPAANAPADDPTSDSTAPVTLEPWEQRMAWLLLPALASLMLLAVTNHVCQDVAVVPFLWVVPLSLYLLTFIICFDRAMWYRRRVMAVASGLAILVLSAALLDDETETVLRWLGMEITIFDYMDNLIVEATLYLTTMFLVCMVCHGELVRLKPEPARLTSFYLMVAAGGALGGIFVALFCPQFFSRFVEMGIGLVAAFLLAMWVFGDDFGRGWLFKAGWRKAIVYVVGFGLLLIVLRAQFMSLRDDALVTVRNFYGVLSVRERHVNDPDFQIREMLHGRILHGSQFQHPERRRTPTTYYQPETGAGVALLNHRVDQPRRIGVVGLGTGTLATFGGGDDYFAFYEINPLVRDLALQYFTYLTDTPAEVEIVLGDARIAMERQPPQSFDILLLDAFTGDAIPVHLLTKEAFAEYFRHLNEDGILVVHISNRHLDLAPVVGGLAEHYQVPAVHVRHDDRGRLGDAGSDWVLLTRNQAFLDDSEVAQHTGPLEYDPIPLWTDQYSNLFQIMD